MAERTLRVALIGQGFMGRAHSNAWRQVGHFFDLAMRVDTRLLCGRNREALERMAATWGWAETATDWRAAVDRPDIDAVDICVPNALHAEVALAALAAGKVVLCEKPMAVSLDESARMAEAARRRRTLVWFNYRRVPAVAFARQLIGEGRIGRVYHYRARYLQEWGNDPTRPPNWKLDKAQAGSGVLGDLLSHVVDLALDLNGPFDEVAALQHTFVPGREIDDATLVLARFANGSCGTLEATRFATGMRNGNIFEIHGAKGMLRFNLEDLTTLEYADATGPRNLQGTRRIMVTGPDQPYARNFWKPGHVTGYEHSFIAALGDFLEALAADREYHPDFADGHRVQEVLDSIERSAAGRCWVSCPR